MQYRALGTSGIQASAVGLGTWAIGGGALWGPTDEGEAITAIQAALDAGITLIDTAPAYGWGRSEEIVGRAIRARRQEVVLATKCGLWWQSSVGSLHAVFDGKRVNRSLRPETLRVEIEDSLRRLQTECIDLYQTHWPARDPDKTPIAETIGCLMRMKEEGKIRAIGVSNVSLAELEENLRAGDVVSNQFRYSMLSRQAEAEILPACQARGVATLTYQSLEQGLLTGKIGMDREFKGEEFRNNPRANPWFQPEQRARVLSMLDGWQELARKYACTLAQLVVAWTMAQPGVTHVLCGSRKAAQIAETAAAGDLALESEDLQRMRDDAESLDSPA